MAVPVASGLGPRTSFPTRSAQSAPESPRPGCPPPAAIGNRSCGPYSRTSRPRGSATTSATPRDAIHRVSSRHLARWIGRAKESPAAARTAFALQRSTVPSRATTRSVPSAAADRTSAPALPGSRIRSSTRTPRPRPTTREGGGHPASGSRAIARIPCGCAVRANAASPPPETSAREPPMLLPARTDSSLGGREAPVSRTVSTMSAPCRTAVSIARGPSSTTTPSRIRPRRVRIRLRRRSSARLSTTPDAPRRVPALDFRWPLPQVGRGAGAPYHTTDFGPG